ncbi:hypothetical protein [Sphingobacterium sp. DR205]|uniref:hypothetical protein n=1 Tax=Sphingobacterium sp. DR205 TaxID=2713573 RepID=UPI0013E474B0|nr:hypothetical protein [Sphingobacterium sp. DR205]QIH33768.1 hypothetical protein G6053_13130 [Sphingobacterium sp. DR205]
MKRMSVLFCLLSFCVSLYADVPIEENQKLREANGTLWYANPWIWLGGVALFLIVFLLLLRKSTRNKTQT